MAAKSVAELALQVENLMRAAYADSGTAVFWPEGFVERGLGDASQILHAFRSLARAARIAVIATVRCDSGHVVWEGPAMEVASHVHDACGRCDDEESVGNWRTFVRAELTSTTRSAIDLGRSGKKKISLLSS